MASTGCPKGSDGMLEELDGCRRTSMHVLKNPMDVQNNLLGPMSALRNLTDLFRKYMSSRLVPWMFRCPKETH
eukprot:4111140-Pyramimonas_sp.AAC.1